MTNVNSRNVITNRKILFLRIMVLYASDVKKNIPQYIAKSSSSIGMKNSPVF